MRCPRCTHTEDKVIDSRGAQNDSVIRRRRMCLGCGHRFTTYEEIARGELRIIKRDGRREEFSRTKLIVGVQRACQKRPISTPQIEAMVGAVIDEVESEYEKEVPSQVVGTKVMERLEKMDHVAFVRFASVYKRFTDANQFYSALQDLISKEE